MNDVFQLGGGAGIGSYVIVFRNGQMDPNTDLEKVRGAYEAGDTIFFSVIDEETAAALVPASGWVGKEGELHLIARDFDDDKTYDVEMSQNGQVVAYEVKDGIEAGGEPLGGSVEIEGNSLVIPEQPGPEPVIEIDGVKYYHKQEFDLEALLDSDGSWNLLNGSTTISLTSSRLGTGYTGGGPSYYAVMLRLNFSGYSFSLIGRESVQVIYTSRAFTIVDTIDEVTDNTKIALPECTHYYGYLSEDGKTFISYYNLKSDGAPEYIDSVKQGNEEVPLHDPRVGAIEEALSNKADLVDGKVPQSQLPEQPAQVSLEGRSLVIPEQEPPQPVATIDGVSYYHKQEFDLEEMLTDSWIGNAEYNVLTGDVLDASMYPHIITAVALGHEAFLEVGLDFQLFIGSLQRDPTYTSRAFTVVDTQEEVTDDTKICLPTCSAYYGFISEDGKTFISYYNLKSDGAVPEYVDSVKQGNAVIPLKDIRLPDATVADVGKVLAVNDQGELVLQTPSTPSGGTQLYKHHLVGATFYQGHELYIVSADNTPIESATDLWVVSQSCLSAYGLQDGGTYPVSIIKIAYYSGSSFIIYHGLSRQPDDSILFNYDYLNLSEFSDTVTEL